MFGLFVPESPQRSETGRAFYRVFLFLLPNRFLDICSRVVPLICGLLRMLLTTTRSHSLSLPSLQYRFKRVCGHIIEVPPPLLLIPNHHGPGPLTHHTVGVALRGFRRLFSLCCRVCYVLLIQTIDSPWPAAFWLISLAISDCSGASVPRKLALILIFWDSGVLGFCGPEAQISSVDLSHLVVLFVCLCLFFSDCVCVLRWLRPRLCNVPVRLLASTEGALEAFWPPRPAVRVLGHQASAWPGLPRAVSTCVYSSWLLY